MPIETVTDHLDPRLVDFHNVPDPVLLREKGLFVAESRLVVRALLEPPRFETRSLLVTSAAVDSLHDLLRSREHDLPIYVGSPHLLRQIVGFQVHRGCLALGVRTPDATDRELPALATARRVVILEQVGNPDNIGSIFRNAAAFGVDCVLLNPTCCDPLYRKAIRTSLGATLRIPYGEISDWPDGLIRLGELGFSSVALTPEADATSLATFAAAPPPRLAILLGAEGVGLSDEATAQVDHRVRIPIARGVDSLNVATTAGIALYTLAPPL